MIKRMMKRRNTFKRHYTYFRSKKAKIILNRHAFHQPVLKHIHKENSKKDIMVRKVKNKNNYTYSVFLYKLIKILFFIVC